MINNQGRTPTCSGKGRSLHASGTSADDEGVIVCVRGHACVLKKSGGLIVIIPYPIPALETRPERKQQRRMGRRWRSLARGGMSVF